MRPEERGAHGQRRRLADTPDDAQHLQLVGRSQPVAALDLHGTRPHGGDLADTPHRLAVEFLFGSAVQQVGGIEDAPAAACDLLVSQAVDLVEELLFAAPGIDQVRMRIAERREKHPAPGVDHLVRGHLAQRIHAPEGCDTPVVGQQPGIVERLQPIHLPTAQAEAAGGLDPDDRTDVLYQQPHSVRRNWMEDSIWGYITESLSMNGTRLR